MTTPEGLPVRTEVAFFATVHNMRTVCYKLDKLNVRDIILGCFQTPNYFCQKKEVYRSLISSLTDVYEKLKVIF